jgi:hypothetical protein
MKLIAHRGNISGPSKRENAVEHIQHALSLGFDAEVDVWYINGWWLGHDRPTYLIDNIYTLFDNSKIWWHCKNFEALEKLQGSDLNYFWHQEDDHTLTSKGYIWTYPGKDVGTRNVIVMPEMVMPVEKIKTLNCYAICSDMVGLL